MTTFCVAGDEKVGEEEAPEGKCCQNGRLVVCQRGRIGQHEQIAAFGGPAADIVERREPRIARSSELELAGPGEELHPFTQ